MKKLTICLIFFSILILSSVRANAMGFSEAINQSKPAAVLIYADWADNAQGVVSAFNTQAGAYSDRYNFVQINIADNVAKEFNKTYHIYPNLPYVLLFKDKGRMSRYLKSDCVTQSSCFKEKLDMFLN